MADNNVQNQVKIFFGKLSPSQKIVLGIVPVIVITALFYMLTVVGTKEKTVLFSGLESTDAAKIVENLKAKNISYQISDNGSSILVDNDIVLDTRLNLASEGLPENSIVGYELFDNTNLGMSEFVQKLNYKRALEGELAKTISSIEEVRRARVHIVIPERAVFTQDRKNPTASITVNLKSGRNVSQKIVEGIQTLVASSVEGMTTNNVSVIDQKGKLLSTQESDMNSISGLTAQQLDQQRKVEEYLSNKVQSMLDNVLGSGNSNIKLNAELDFTRIEQTKTEYDPDKSVLRSEQTLSEASKSTDSLYYLAVVNDRNQINTIQNYEVSQNVESIVHSVGHIKRMSVAAVINSIPRISENEGKKTVEYLPRSDEEMRKLTEIIKNAVGYNPERNDQITVNNVQFDTDLEDIEVEIASKLEWYEEPYNQKLMLLVTIIMITMILMYRFMQSKIIKERVRIALDLPSKAEITPDLDTDQNSNFMDDLSLDNNLMLLPSELPEQLLLDGDNKMKSFDETSVLESSMVNDSKSLVTRSSKKVRLHDTDFDEDNMMKMELRNKIQDYIFTKPDDAARLVRVFINQEPENINK